MLLANVKKLCEEQGKTISCLEREAGIKPKSIYKWRNTTPSVEKVKAVADALGVKVDDLLNENDQTAPY